MADDATKKTDGEQVPTPPETTDDKTVGAIIDETLPPAGDKTPKTEPETVPLPAFLDMKKDAKKFEKLYNELVEKNAKGDSTKEEINDDLQALAEEFDIDPKFVSKLGKILESKAEKKAGDAIKPILDREAALTKKEKDALIDAAFTKHYGEALEKMPEYSEIANADTIKALSLLPQNANKTFAQLIEETYGKAITGKRTIEPTKPAGGKDPEPLDMERARKDPKYFEEVMANPTQKAEYNRKMLEPNRRRG